MSDEKTNAEPSGASGGYAIHERTPTMIIRDLLEMLVRHASEFRKDLDHYSRNSHMHAIREAPTQDQIDAVLTGFINRIAGSMGVDYGLYTSDLAKGSRDAASAG